MSSEEVAAKTEKMSVSGGASEKQQAGKAKKKHEKAHVSDSAHPMELAPPPGYLQSRIELFDRLKAEADAVLAGRSVRG